MLSALLLSKFLPCITLVQTGLVVCCRWVRALVGEWLDHAKRAGGYCHSVPVL